MTCVASAPAAASSARTRVVVWKERLPEETVREIALCNIIGGMFQTCGSCGIVLSKLHS